MAKTQLELPAGEQCLGAIEEYYDHLPVRRGLASWIAWDLGNSKSRKISQKKGRRHIKKGNK